MSYLDDIKKDLDTNGKGGDDKGNGGEKKRKGRYSASFYDRLVEYGKMSTEERAAIETGDDKPEEK